MTPRARRLSRRCSLSRHKSAAERTADAGHSHGTSSEKPLPYGPPAAPSPAKPGPSPPLFSPTAASNPKTFTPSTRFSQCQ
ncbi:MAG: hypothetical protein BWZ02_01949 [Lentisphaerae bacterium ADurb.BinA184]|nr:MAG: hypothetical protein BWZ02_01949 [Lentisphaerae bacterium ADurb.BinA184]